MSTALPHLIVTDFDFAPPDRDRLMRAVGTDSMLFVKGHDELRGVLQSHPETDVLCTFRPFSDTLTLAPHLRWIALPSAGADNAIRAGLVGAEGAPIVTTASGVHAVPISEFVFGMLLMWVRDWPAMIAAQHTATWPDRAGWEALRGHELAGATLGILGLGAIGRQIARIGRAFGMRVIATRRSINGQEHDPDVDALIPLMELRELLRQSDFVVVAVPSTPQTHHLLGKHELAAMKPSAVLVNIARGNIVDEDALVTALQSGVIAGAALDVFEEEPLPTTSPLWKLPNVILSPHVAGSTDQYSRRFTDLFLANIEHYRRSEPLRNVVVADRGY